MMDILVILGATATGKTRLAVQMARRFDGEIVSADSRQVYRGLDIGTGKDLEEYGDTPHHLIDVTEPEREFNLYAFLSGARARLREIHDRGRLPIVAGGTGLYLEGLIQGYRLTPAPPDPVLREELQTLTDDRLAARLLELQPRQHNTTDLESRERMIRAIEVARAERADRAEPAMPTATGPDRERFLTLGVRWERSVLRERIATRLRQRLASGLIGEVDGLLTRGVPPESLIALGLEYRFVTRHLLGELRADDLEVKLHQAICQFAKRQETWFRRMERHGIPIHWLAGEDDPVRDALEIIATRWPRRRGQTP